MARSAGQGIREEAVNLLRWRTRLQEEVAAGRAGDCIVDSDRPNLDRLVVGERVWSPTYEGAPNTLRVVSFDWMQKHSPIDFTVSGWSIWKEGLPQDGPKNDRQFSRRCRMLLRETYFSSCHGTLRRTLATPAA